MSNWQPFTTEAISHYPELDAAIRNSGIVLDEIAFVKLEITHETVSIDKAERTGIGKDVATLLVLLKNGSEQEIGQINGPIRYV